MADGTLNYEFKIDAPAASVENLSHKVDDLTRSMERAHHTGGAHMESLEHKIRHELGGVGHAVNYVKNEMHDLLETLGLILVYEGLEKIADKIIEIGEEALTAAAKGERMDLAFELSLGREGGADMIDFMERIGKFTEFTEFQLKGWGKELLNAGVAAEDLDKYMAAAVDVAAKSPDKMEGMQKAITALQRANLTGNIDMRQLRGLSIGVDQLKELPKFAGMSAIQIKKQLTKGKLTKEELLEIIAGPDKVLGDLGVRAGKTLEARFTHLKAIPEEVFAKLRKTEGFDHLSNAIETMLSKLDPDSPRMKAIVEVLGEMVDKFASMIEQVDWEDVLDSIAGGLETINDIIGMIVKGVRFAKDLWVEFKEEAGVAPKGTYAKHLAKQKLVEDTERGHEMARAASKSDFADLDEAASSGALGASSKKYFDLAHHVGEQTGEGYAKGMKKSSKHGRKAASGVAADSVDQMEDELDVNSPSVVFQDIGAMAAAGYAAGLAGGGDSVDAAVDRMLRVPRAGQAGVAGGGGGGVTLTIEHVEVHVEGHATEADGQAAASGFAKGLRPELLDLLEQVKTELGA